MLLENYIFVCFLYPFGIFLEPFFHILVIYYIIIMSKKFAMVQRKCYRKLCGPYAMGLMSDQVDERCQEILGTSS